MNKMKHLLILIPILITSCAFPRYKHVSEVRQKIDFSSGQWVLNNVGAPTDVDDKLSLLAFKKLKKYGCDNLVYVDSLRLKSPLPAVVSFNLDTSTLSDMKNILMCDYFISFKSEILENSVKDIMPLVARDFSKSKAQTSIIIYDLNYGTKIYSDQIIGSIALGQNDYKILFAKSGNSLMKGTFNRILKRVKKNSK